MPFRPRDAASSPGEDDACSAHPYDIRMYWMAYARNWDRKKTTRRRKRLRKANFNPSSRYLHFLRTPANTGENPRKRWASRNGVSLCSLLFDGFGDRKVAADGALRSFCGRIAGRKRGEDAPGRALSWWARCIPSVSSEPVLAPRASRR
jgi:hypothetical protein